MCWLTKRIIELRLNMFGGCIKLFADNNLFDSKLFTIIGILLVRFICDPTEDGCVIITLSVQAIVVGSITRKIMLEINLTWFL